MNNDIWDKPELAGVFDGVEPHAESAVRRVVASWQLEGWEPDRGEIEDLIARTRPSEGRT
ncbi:hypothetical protein [Nocardia suismassiliense]|uniref:hypothetical protein n=1 Tax=Nocardia suismassiliense TaxID=2077092 RepID=UPI000D1F308D|nr:hypothetical protein [Nocardia suismassiliense]